MNQNIITIIGGVAILAIIVVVYIKNRQGEGSKIANIFDFLDSISDTLGNFVAEAIEVMRKDPSKYDSEDDFYKDLIGQAVRIIKELCHQNDIDTGLIDNIPEEDLEDYIYMIIERVIDRVEVKAIVEEQPKAEEPVVVEEPADAANLEDIDDALSGFYTMIE